MKKIHSPKSRTLRREVKFFLAFAAQLSHFVNYLCYLCKKVVINITNEHEKVP